jgi:hypothetical protein
MRTALWSLISLAIIMLLGATDAGAHSRAKSHRQIHCAIPRGARLTAQDADVRIILVSASYTDANGNSDRDAYKYCLRRQGGYNTFAGDYSDNGGLGDTGTVSFIA